MANNRFKLAEKLKAAQAASDGGDFEKSLTTYREIVARYPGNKTARKGLRAVEKLLAAQPAEFQDDTVSEQRFAVFGQASLSGIEDPLKIPQRRSAAPPPVEPANDLLGAVSGQNQINISVSSAKTARQLYVEGLAAKEAGDPGKAIDLLKAAAAQAPDLHEAQSELGLLLKEAGDTRAAIKVLSALTKRVPDMRDAHINLGACHAEAGDYEAAIGSLTQALEIDPAHPKTLCNLGILHGRLGDQDEAVRFFQRSIDCDPSYATGFALLSQATKFREDDPLIDRMLTAQASARLDQSQQAKLHFALGKAFDDIGDTDKAFTHITRANDLSKKTRPFNYQNDRAVLEKMHRGFADQVLPQLAGAEANNSPVVPIFIVGMPRSGSTLIERVLSSHSQVQGAGEIEDLQRCLNAAMDAHSDDPLSTDMLLDFRARYLAKLKTMSDGKPFVTDKNLLNFRFAGFIAAAFPEARIIHMKRDPMAVCWSNYKSDFTVDTLSFAFDLDHLGEYFGLYAKLMKLWHKKFPDRITDVDYDAFVRAPKDQTRVLLDRCGLAFEDACLRFYESARPEKTASMFQVRKQIFQDSSRQWERYRDHLGAFIAKYHDLLMRP